MKNNSFAGLLYCEYYLGKTSYITAMVFYLGSVLLGWLMLLSIKHGNLGLLFGEDLNGGIIKNKEVSEILRLTIYLTMKFLPLTSTTLMCMVSADTVCKDIMIKWSRFEHCTPLTPVRFAAVKTISAVVQTSIGTILSIVYLFTLDIALGEKLTYGDISLITITVAVMTMISVSAQIFVTLLKSRDMGWLCTMGVFLLPTSIISFINAAKENNMPSADKPKDITMIIAELTDKAQKYCPVVLAVLGISFAVMFVSMYLLYKRREK